MRFKILTVGHKIPSAVTELIREYEKRLRPWAQVTWLRTDSGHGNESAVREDESQRLSARLSPGEFVVLLDERGKVFDNPALLRQFEQWRQHTSAITFIIGGAFGVTDELRDRADVVWSFSPLVFPHQLVQPMLLEQLYRTCTMLSNHPYHHQ